MEVPWRLVKSLQKKKEREKSRLTVAEGAPSVLSALRSAAAYDFLVTVSGYLESEKGAEIARALKAHPNPGTTFVVSSGLFHKISGTSNPQGILLVLPFPFCYGGSLPSSPWPKLLWVAGADIQDPGNVGTLVRNAAGAGAWGVTFLGESADPYSPKCIRSSAGAVFGIVVKQAGNPVAQVRTWLDSGSTVYKTLPSGGNPPWEVDLRESTILVMGNEARGLRKEIDCLIPDGISIPMPGGIQSLNVAMASSMILYEAMRQRIVPGGSLPF